MNFIKLPSGCFINLDAFSITMPSNKEDGSVRFCGLTSAGDVRCCEEDAKYIFAYLEYMRHDTVSNGFTFK
jgi:hypothetical protein